MDILKAAAKRSFDSIAKSVKEMNPRIEISNVGTASERIIPPSGLKIPMPPVKAPKK